MRTQDWVKKLNNYIKDITPIPFEWGVMDCLIFVSDWCKICCDIDPMAYKLENDPITIRGAYSDAKSARKLIIQHRGDIHNIMDIHFKRVPIKKAQRGDVVLADLEDGLTFGIVNDGFLFKCESGLTKRGFASVAWRVD